MKKKPTIQGCQQNLFELDPIKPEPKPKQKSDDSYVFDLMDVLRSPVLTFSLAWADIIPERLLKIVTIARLKASLLKETMATYPEVVIYIYTRSMDAPMPSEWVDIYTHVSCSTCAEYFNEDHWDQVPAPRVLSDWLRGKLDDLRRHIFQKRREALKQRLKTEDAARPDPQPEPAPDEPASTQQSLFA